MPDGSGDGELIGEIMALKRQRSHDDALKMLTRVYRYVLPIMRKRGLRVGRLAEFYPKNPSLLGVNVNRGAQIRLRLRHASNVDLFLPFDDVLGTMLHELCHNTHGPHNAAFFARLGELEDEMDRLLRQGFQGDLFIGGGDRLGSYGGARHQRHGHGHASAQPPARRGRRGHGRGRKLGGPRLEGDPRALALDAAERRRRADRECEHYTDDSGEHYMDDSGEHYTDDRYEPPVKRFFVDLLD